MFNSKILQILRGLSQEELKQFQQYILSPYFVSGRKRDEILSLFKLLKRHWPAFDHPSLAKDIVYRKLYPGELPVSSKLEKLMSRLLGHLRGFIIQQESELGRTTNDELLILMKYYRQRQLTNLLQISERKYEQELAQKKQFDLADYYLQFQREQQIVDDERNYNVYKTPRNLPHLLESLDDYFLISRLKYTVQMLALNQAVIPVETKDSLAMIQILLPIIEQRRHTIPLLNLYYLAYRLLTAAVDKQEQAFQALRDYLKQCENTTPPPIYSAMQTLVRNFCVDRWILGQPYFLDITFDVYREHLEAGYLYYQDKLLPATIGNIVQTGLHSRAYDWIRDFLEAHRDRIIGTAYPDNVYRYNLATYYLAIKDYDRALDCIYDAFDDSFYRIASRQLEIQVLYEMNAETLDARLDAFKIFIYRLTDEQCRVTRKEALSNFVDLLRQMRSTANWQRPKRVQKLKEKALSTKNLVARAWLLKMMDNLA